MVHVDALALPHVFMDKEEGEERVSEAEGRLHNTENGKRAKIFTKCELTLPEWTDN